MARAALVNLHGTTPLLHRRFSPEREARIIQLVASYHRSCLGFRLSPRSLANKLRGASDGGCNGLQEERSGAPGSDHRWRRQRGRQSGGLNMTAVKMWLEWRPTFTKRVWRRAGAPIWDTWPWTAISWSTWSLACSAVMTGL